MNTQEQAIFEARAVLQAHVNLLAAVVNAGATADGELQGQIERVKAAAQRYLNLPRPVEKAA